MKLSPPTDLAGLARLILSPECRSICVLTGAGVSVASGIPDFRSPGGMYDTLQPDLITASPAERQLMRQDPTYVVSWDIFRQNQFPYLEVRKPFILGTREKKWKATISHRFFELLHTKTNKLTRLYTQNIDGLDFQCTKIPTEKIVPVHGSLSQVQCEGCETPVDLDTFCDQLESNVKDIYSQGDANPKAPKESTNIPCLKCKRPLVKPTTVLFGRSLPEQFFQCTQSDLPSCDLLIVAGTSLVVSPANSLVYAVPETTIRVVVNRDPVGQELGISYGGDQIGRDMFAQGDCDQVFLELVKELGWMDDLKLVLDDLPPSSVERIRKL